MLFPVLRLLVRLSARGMLVASIMPARHTAVVNEITAEEPAILEFSEVVAEEPIIHTPTPSEFVYLPPTTTRPILIRPEQGAFDLVNKHVLLVYLAIATLLFGLTVQAVASRLVRGARAYTRRSTDVEEAESSPAFGKVEWAVLVEVPIVFLASLLGVLVHPFAIALELLVFVFETDEYVVPVRLSAAPDISEALQDSFTLVERQIDAVHKGFLDDPSRSFSGHFGHSHATPFWLADLAQDISAQQASAHEDAQPSDITAADYELDASGFTGTFVAVHFSQDASIRNDVEDTPELTDTTEDGDVIAESASDEDQVSGIAPLGGSISADFRGMISRGSFALAANGSMDFGSLASRSSFALVPSASVSSLVSVISRNGSSIAADVELAAAQLPEHLVLIDASFSSSGMLSSASVALAPVIGASTSDNSFFSRDGSSLRVGVALQGAQQDSANTSLLRTFYPSLESISDGLSSGVPGILNSFTDSSVSLIGSSYSADSELAAVQHLPASLLDASFSSSDILSNASNAPPPGIDASTSDSSLFSRDSSSFRAAFALEVARQDPNNVSLLRTSLSSRGSLSDEWSAVVPGTGNSLIDSSVSIIGSSYATDSELAAVQHLPASLLDVSFLSSDLLSNASNAPPPDIGASTSNDSLFSRDGSSFRAAFALEVARQDPNNVSLRRTSLSSMGSLSDGWSAVVPGTSNSFADGSIFLSTSSYAADAGLAAAQLLPESLLDASFPSSGFLSDASLAPAPVIVASTSDNSFFSRDGSSLRADLAFEVAQQDPNNFSLMRASLSSIGMLSTGWFSHGPGNDKSFAGDSSFGADAAFQTAQGDPTNTSLLRESLSSLGNVSSGSLALAFAPGIGDLRTDLSFLRNSSSFGVDMGLQAAQLDPANTSLLRESVSVSSDGFGALDFEPLVDVPFPQRARGTDKTGEIGNDKLQYDYPLLKAVLNEKTNGVPGSDEANGLAALKEERRTPYIFVDGVEGSMRGL